VWTLLCNIPIARRRTMCFVLDAEGDLRWSGKSVGAGFRWLHEQEHNCFRLEGTEPDERFEVKMSPV